VINQARQHSTKTGQLQISREFDLCNHGTRRSRRHYIGDLHALAGNFMRALATPRAAGPWSLNSLREKLLKVDAKVVSDGRDITFEIAEVLVSWQMLAEISC
jgi:hypothetical protein